MKKRKGIRRGIVIMALLSGISAAVWLLAARSRQSIVSKTDPMTGYRCSFTLSRNWQRSEVSHKVVFDPGVKILDSARYFPVPPTALQTWIETHLLHPAAPSSPGPREIYLVIFHDRLPPNMILKDGYPELNLSNLHVMPGIKVLSNRHYLLDGQPATQCKLIMMFPYGAKMVNTQVNALMLKMRDQPFYVVVEGKSDEAHEAAIQAEIDAIRESFHLEKPGGH